MTDSFTWGLNEKIGASVSIEASAGIPLVGEVKTTISMTA